MSSRIESRPTDGLTYNPNDSKYWDRGAFEKEDDPDLRHLSRLPSVF